VASAPTPSQTVGPFFSFGLCDRLQAELVEPDSDGAITIEGRVLDGDGEPVPDAMVELWQADETGRYREDFGWGRCGTDAEGRYAFVTVKPGPVPGEDGVPQAPHVTALVFARGLLKPVLTRVYFADEEEANAVDRVLSAIEDGAARATLVAEGRPAYRFDIRLQGERQTVFFAL
jgi:protocatechuate 3,4-dioxygenase alpha subunit